ncbi:NAD(P)-binding protein [Rhizodiscina lignyota]|uniref:NAD(P)-binding protein n=1 Tax=Rhizodiscina lignyota TaxID=1504668 RepID=A0A9P4IL53_9PEZI|nr:NAD(P)-binding protein [Rhizodiscina lignyota]
MVNILVTGATGYIGGDALYAIANALPDPDNIQFTCTVRDSDKGAIIAKEYPKVKLAYGDLDAYDMLVEEASKADIVLHFANCDHEGAANAIVEGLSKRSGTSYLIHTSGTGILTVEDVHANVVGRASNKVYDDWDGIKEVTSLPDDAWHRKVDKIILGAHEKSGGKIKTAIVCPPTIYGPGRGPGNKKSDQVYKMAAYVLKSGKAFMVGEGLNTWTYIHVHDLSDLYLKLTEAALQGGGNATWNEEGYYFTENGEFLWGEMAEKVAQEVYKQGFIKDPTVAKLGMEEANNATPNGGRKWGLNSRCRATRGRKLLGWSPKGESIENLLPSIVKGEAVDLGLSKTHAAEAAGE